MQVSSSVAALPTAIQPAPTPTTAANTTSSNAAPVSTTSTASGSSSPSDVWSSDSVTQALKVINDTSGKSSLSDQLSSYDYLMNLMTGGGTGGGVPGGADRVAVWNAVLQSPFAQQVNQAQDTYAQNYATPHGVPGSVGIQNQINSFNGLSSTQQIILVDQMNQNQMNPAYSTSKPIFVSVASFQSYQQTQLSAAKTIESAFSAGTLNYASMSDPSSIQDPKLAAFVRAAAGWGVSDTWATQTQAALDAYSTASASAKPAVTVTLSDTAKAALAASSTNASSAPEGAAEQALKTLTSTSQGATKADAALSILKNSAAERASAATTNIQSKEIGQGAGTNPSQQPYSVGLHFSTTA